MATTPNMGIELPEPGGDAGTWDDKINQAIEDIDAHDHVAGAGLPIRAAALDIDDDIPMQGNGLTSVGRVAFDPIAALTSGAVVLFVNTADNELYWRTAAGTNVKLTLGTSINTSLVGGIVGDYSTVGAEVAYDDSGDRYTFKQQGGSKPWARLASGAVRIYETGSTESVFVGLNAPTALGASYDITWPTAVPGSTSVMLMDSSGNVSVSNTIPNAIVFSAGVTCSTTLGVTGAVTLSSTLGVTGLATFTAGATAAANQHITVSGTGRHKRGTRFVTLPMHSGLAIEISGTVSNTGGQPGIELAVSTVAKIMLPYSDAELSGTAFQSFRIYNDISGTGNVTVEPFFLLTDGTFASQGSAQALAIANPLVYTAGTSAPDTGQTMWLQITTPGTNSGTIFSVALESTVP